MNNKMYLKILFSILGFIFLSSVVYAYYFSKHYPIPVTSRISLDAKIKFIRENIDPNKIDTIIVGSSIGLNNIQGTYLEKSSVACKSVLNLSVYESNPVKVQQILELSDAFPNLKRIIYSAQFFDFHGTAIFKEYNPTIIQKYIRHELSIFENFKIFFNASKNIPFLILRQFEWEKLHGSNNTYTYLGFDATGSVPLSIYGKDILKSRWGYSSWFPHHGKKPYHVLDRMTIEAHKNGIRYYFIQQPYRTFLVKKYSKLNSEINWFLDKTKKIVEKNNGYFLSLQRSLPLQDIYYADRSHLNDKGSILAAEAIGKFIDQIEK